MYYTYSLLFSYRIIVLNNKYSQQPYCLAVLLVICTCLHINILIQSFPRPRYHIIIQAMLIQNNAPMPMHLKVSFHSLTMYLSSFLRHKQQLSFILCIYSSAMMMKVLEILSHTMTGSLTTCLSLSSSTTTL